LVDRRHRQPGRFGPSCCRANMSANKSKLQSAAVLAFAQRAAKGCERVRFVQADAR
jgi:hypothetical protein